MFNPLLGLRVARFCLRFFGGVVYDWFGHDLECDGNLDYRTRLAQGNLRQRRGHGDGGLGQDSGNPVGRFIGWVTRRRCEDRSTDSKANHERSLQYGE